MVKYRAISENHLFGKVYTKGKKAITKTVAVYVLQDRKAKMLMKANPSKTKINRIGITVSKKLGKAVMRNRAKRLLRAGFYAVDKKITIKKGYLIVLVARNHILSVKSDIVAKDIEKALYEIDMIEKENEKVL